MRYGSGEILEIDFPSDAQISSGPGNDHNPLSDVVAAVTVAVCEPLGYPPLCECVVPGDQVAVVLDEAVPHVSAILTGILHELIKAGVSPASCTVVCTIAHRDRVAEIKEQLPDWAREVPIVVHDPIAKKYLSYLAASEDGAAIYFNRTIADADFVVPIAAIRSEDAHDYFGIHTSLFPAFADDSSQRRFYSREVDNSTKHRKESRKETNEAAWLLGIQFTVQVIPGAGSSILHVLAGQAEEVYQQGRALSNSAWRCDFPSRADLVLAGIEGGAEQQTWASLARALEAACQVVTEHGTIVLCTELGSLPGPALQRLSGVSGGLSHTLHAIGEEPAFDCSPAAIVAVARERARIFLLSQLNEETVEDLGFGFVAHAGEINNLLRAQKSCILLPNAQNVAVDVEEIQ